MMEKENKNIQKKKEIKILWNDTQQTCPIRFDKDEETHNSIITVAGGEENRVETLHKTFGSSDIELLTSIVGSAAPNAVGSYNQRDNSVIQAISDMQPKNSMEARLAAQTSVLYERGMLLLRLANEAETIPRQEHFMKFAVKLLRLHNETALALDRIRRGGEQKVIVQHVNVEGGAQAIVNNGNLSAGGGEGRK